MDIQLKRQIFDARLPSAICTKEMLTALKALAKAEDTSESAIIRAGVAFILELKTRKPNK